VIEVEVVYALPSVQRRYTVRAPAPVTARAAIEASGLLRDAPEIDLAVNRVGVFGKAVGLDALLAPGDRVEVYRPLAADPKDARRRRVREAKGPA
jgi:putative ubiquitin-RnfH superfamily antitoxin RatB of RatAB toxin-antitoxin module